MDILKARKLAREMQQKDEAPGKPEKAPKEIVPEAPAKKAAEQKPKKPKPGKKKEKAPKKEISKDKKVKHTALKEIPIGAKSPDEIKLEPHEISELPGTQDMPFLPGVEPVESHDSVAIDFFAPKPATPDKKTEKVDIPGKKETLPMDATGDVETEEGEDDKTIVLGEMPLEFLSFTIGKEEYGILLQRINEIIKPRPITEVPRLPSFVLGILTLRGVVIPVFDLAMRLSLGQVKVSKSSRIVIVSRGEEKVGLLVDNVRDVVRVLPRDIEPPPPVMTGVDMQFLEGVGRAEGADGIRKTFRKEEEDEEEKESRVAEKARRRLVILLNLERVASL